MLDDFLISSVYYKEGGRSIFWWTGNKKFQYGISRFWEKYGPETVFSTLDSAGNY